MGQYISAAPEAEQQMEMAQIIEETVHFSSPGGKTAEEKGAGI